MSFFPIPDVHASDVFRISPKLLTQKGITLLLLDLDNTLSPYSEHLPPARVLEWMKRLKAAGIAPYLISNNASDERVRRYAEACDIPYVARAGKPKPEAVIEAMGQMGRSPAQTALMGDQIFTDGLAAKRAGITSIVVRPLEMPFLFRLRYIAEQPFRALGKEKYR